MDKYNKKYFSKRNGSVLVFTLFMMMISLVVGIGLMSTASIGRKSTLATTKSVNSLQVADNGIEYAMETIKEHVETYATVGEPPMVSEADGKLEDVFGANCTDGVVTNGTSGYILYFYNQGGTKAVNCTFPVGTIKKIESVGTYNGVTRAVESTNLTLDDVFITS